MGYIMRCNLAFGRSLARGLDFVLLEIKSFLLREKSLTEFDSSESRQKTPQIWHPRWDWTRVTEWTTAFELTNDQHNRVATIKQAIYLQEKRKEPSEESETACPVVPGDQVYLRVFRRKWNEPRREGPYTVVRATPTAVQVEGSTTWYHLNHCTRVPTGKAERKESRQSDNAGESNEEESETHDEVQTDESSFLLSDKLERTENQSDNMSEDHPMPNASHNADSNSTDRKQPDFPSIDFTTFEQK
ncbi:uncharacterized protein LOC127968690 isoform X2 [Carassius gibelio]|uniref:uncharacterized protein LOC127968690 isoform X2 n=1 Tax=Carassius gibelio TaxID=101364 RepID=UPI002279D44F|nr:uncharacterized protein LOC127968690 isoform X2 [Carassius gibelio]